MSSPQGNKNGPQGIENLPTRNGNALKYLRVKADGIGMEWVVVGVSGEVNTASNIGTAGVGVWLDKVGVDLRFKKINSGSSKVTITDDVGDNEVDVDVVPANFTGIPQSGVTNLVTDLSNKSAVGHTHVKADITDFAHTHPTSEVTGLDTALSNKQPLDASLTEISGLTLNNDDIIQQKVGVLTNRTPAQFKTDLVLVKSDVGLGNVDNTSDVNKPVSTATQTALNLKEDDLPSMVGNMGKVLAVNGTETGKEWIVAGGTDIIGKQRSWIGI